MGFEYIRCPICKNTATVSYEENREYSCICGTCDTDIRTNTDSFDSALRFFKSIRFEQKDRPLTKRELDIMFAAKDK